jgi:membrane-associated phospholipid phosphatase
MTSTHQPVRSLPAAWGPFAQFRQWRLRIHHRSWPGIAWLVVSRIAVIYMILYAYSWLRKTWFLRPDDLAYANALDLIEFQGWLGIAVTNVEIPLQRWVLEHPALIDFFNTYYRTFKPALYLCAALCLLLAPGAFGRVLRVFLLATIIAFPWYALYPLAPPRLIDPFGFGFVDTLAVYGGVESTAGGAGGANQFAAMPSMHIGWTVIAALWLAAAIPWRGIGALLGAAHVLLMCVTVVVTGNHYVLDIVGGFVVAGSAVALERVLPGPWRSHGSSPILTSPRPEGRNRLRVGQGWGTVGPPDRSG